MPDLPSAIPAVPPLDPAVAALIGQLYVANETYRAALTSRAVEANALHDQLIAAGLAPDPVEAAR